MRIIALLLSIFIVGPAFADDLDDAIATCVSFKDGKPTIPFTPHVRHTTAAFGPITPATSDLGNPEKGWEDCTAIIEARNARWDARRAADQKARETDETQNPDLKKMRETARKLKAEPAK